MLTIWPLLAAAVPTLEDCPCDTMHAWTTDSTNLRAWLWWRYKRVEATKNNRSEFWSGNAACTQWTQWHQMYFVTYTRAAAWLYLDESAEWRGWAIEANCTDNATGPAVFRTSSTVRCPSRHDSWQTLSAGEWVDSKLVVSCDPPCW
eukprot:583834-Prymnesium_polylepis.1